MATFPAALASLPRPTAQTKRNAPGFEGHALQNQLADEIEAIEGVIGVTGSMVPTSIEYRLAEVQAVAALADGDISILQDKMQDTEDRLGSRITNIIPHRGVSAYFREGGLASLREGLFHGFVNVDTDAYLLADYSIGIFHDATVDATTNGTGSTTSFTRSTFKSLQLDKAMQGCIDVENPLLIDEVIDLVLSYSDAVLWVEAKTTATLSPIIAKLRSRCVPHNRAVIQTFDASLWETIVASGYACCALIADAASLSPASISAAGIEYVGAATILAGQISQFHAVNVKCCLYTINNRYDYAEAISNGIDIVWSDDPAWIANIADRSNKNSFTADARFSPGAIWTNLAPTMEQGFLVWSSTANGYYGQMQGWACPIKNDAHASTFGIDTSITFTAVASADRWAAIFICATTDQLFADLPSSVAPTGYHLLIRQDGRVQIYRKDPSVAAALLATTNGSARTIGQSYSVQVTVSPTQITLSVGADSVTLSDATYRGGYFWLGRTGAAVKFGDVTIS